MKFAVAMSCAGLEGRNQCHGEGGKVEQLHGDPIAVAVVLEAGIRATALSGACLVDEMGGLAVLVKFAKATEGGWATERL